MTINLYAGWIGFLVGCLAGAIPGLFFYHRGWLGGYASWPRRMLRLGHISLFGIGFLNILFALTCHILNIESGIAASSMLLIIGAITMPIVCYLSAWKSFIRHFFFVPVFSITIAILFFLGRILL